MSIGLTVNKILNFCKYSFLIYLLVPGDPNTAQLREFKYKQITTEDGLVDDMVLRIRQDANGYMWFGTRSGLVRYDGRELHTYTYDPNQPKGLSGNNIDALHKDKSGNLWIGTINGLCKFDTNLDHPIIIPLKGRDQDTTPQISDITSDGNGLIWIGTYREGLFSFNPGTNESVHYYHDPSEHKSLPNSNVMGLLYTSGSELLIGTRRGVYRFDQSTGTFENYCYKNSFSFELSDSIVISLEEGKNGDIWIGTVSGGLNRINLDKKLHEVYIHNPNDPNSLSDNLITSIMSDNDKLWLGCGRGSGALQSMNLNTGKITKYKISEKKLGPRIRGTITDIFKDNAGIIWVSQSYGGISYFDPIWENYQHYQLNPQNPRDLINAVYGTLPVSNSKLWLSSFDGFILFDREDGILEQYNDNGNPVFLRNNPVILNNKLYAPSDHGIVKLDLKEKEVSNPIEGEQGLAGKYVNKIIVDKDNYIWAGSRSGGLDRINPVTGYVKHFENVQNDTNSLPENSVYVLYEIDDRYLWVGTNGGLALFDKYKEAFSNYPYDPTDSLSISSNQISDIYTSSSGTLWIATYGGGLNRLNRDTQNFRRYTSQNDNIPNNTVYSCIEDDDGNIWISTAFAIGRFSPEKETCDFVLKEADYYKVSKLPGGELCYSGPKGVLIINPKNIEINSIPPKLSIERVTINGEPIEPDAGKSENLLELEHYQNDIEFKFFAAHFSNAVQNNYNVMLKGYDNDWRNLGSSNFINYTNLEPGSYTLHAKAANSFNIWSNPIAMKIYINRPFWRTWWAYLFYTIFVMGFLYSVRKIELNRQRKNAAVKESKLRAESAELQAMAAEAQARAIQAENERKTMELEEARKLQLSLLPKELPQFVNMDIAVYMKTATEVGGDYYDFSVKEDGSLNIALGDATGHGMKAGTIVSMMKSLFTANSIRNEIDDFFNVSNNALKKSELDKMMMAFAMVNIDGMNQMKIANAGIPPVFIYRAKEHYVEEIKLNGLPLGAMKNMSYNVITTELNKSDVVLMLSDGMPELQNENGEMCGYERIKDLFANCVQLTSEAIKEKIKDEIVLSWINDKDPQDDITFVVIKIK